MEIKENTYRFKDEIKLSFLKRLKILLTGKMTVHSYLEIFPDKSVKNTTVLK